MVKVPCAESSETMAMADAGERATARHAMMSVMEKAVSGVASAVTARKGRSSVTPVSTSA